MQIPFNLPHVFNPEASTLDNDFALRVLLDCLIGLNQAWLVNHSAVALYDSGVVYGRTVLWEPIPALYARGFGDCKSLTAARIAQLRSKRIACKPVFRWRRRQGGELDYHILVMRENGQFEDPSKVLGMGTNENAPMLRQG